MALASSERATPRGCGLPTATADALADAGFDVCGLLTIDAYDERVPPPWRSGAMLPGAQSAILLGTGGGRFEAAWTAAAAALDGPGDQPSDPADDFARGVCDTAATSISSATGERAGASLYCDERALPGGEPVFADFVALAEVSGLGARSRLGLLLHPVHGPWWSVRALILTTWSLAEEGGDARSLTPIASSPCVGCAAPCITACPAGAVGEGPFDAAACGRQRLEGDPCASHCAARRACVVGDPQAYGETAEAHYGATSLSWIRRAAAAGESVP